ncbi:hypothetical protein B0J11DRAFT_536311 [Dendryphion nanum]|uniref:Uncharacterized protein n=1 Tax=Dendryphion nanum TaxID=256645 RepID=A0A9P9DE49_9PLEO|nr:hypothetical protein B0J11DRAFT_536311 [Dendryphion nanum]
MFVYCPDRNYPVHLGLAIYRDNNRPEYEAVSYVWGGRKGDSTPCQPIYVGPF